MPNWLRNFTFDEKGQIMVKAGKMEVGATITHVTDILVPLEERDENTPAEKIVPKARRGPDDTRPDQFTAKGAEQPEEEFETQVRKARCRLPIFAFE